MQSRIFREFLAYFKMKKKGDKKGDKALRNEQELRCHKQEVKQSSELGLSVEQFTFAAIRL